MQPILSLPSDTLAEQSALGALLLGGAPSVEAVSDRLKPLDFYRPGHGAIYEAMTYLARSGHAVDVVTLRAELQRRGSLEAVGGVAYLMSLGDIVPAVSSLRYYATRVIDEAQKRRLYCAALEISQAALGGECEAAELADMAEQRILDATSDRRGGDAYRTMAALVDEAMDQVQEALLRGGGLAGISSGLERWDWLVGGLAPAQLHIVAGRPGMGKSVFGNTVALNVASQGGRVAMFTTEMSATAVVKRLCAAVSRVNASKVRTGRLTREEFGHLCQRSAEELQGLPLTIDDTSAITPAQIQSRVRKIIADLGPVDLVVVDYLQRLHPDATRQGGTRAEEVSQIAQSLKTMAGKLSVPVLAMAQPNRNNERRDDKRPGLSDLADSSGIEKEADTVTFLYRPAYYEKRQAEDIPDYEECEFIVAKNREGSTGTVRALFSGAFQRFDNLAEEEGGF